MEYILNLDYTENPDYDLLIKIFRRLLKSRKSCKIIPSPFFQPRAKSSRMGRKLSETVFKIFKASDALKLDNVPH
jgi:hypothetical protein